MDDLKKGINSMIEESKAEPENDWKQTKMASGTLHEQSENRIMEENTPDFKGKQYRVGGTGKDSKVYGSLDEAKSSFKKPALKQPAEPKGIHRSMKEAGMKVEPEAQAIMSEADKQDKAMMERQRSKSVKTEPVKSSNKPVYAPKTNVEKKVDAWIEQNWKDIDKNGDLGSLAYNMSRDIRAPYPVLMDAVSKSVAARNEREKPVESEEVSDDDYGYLDPRTGEIVSKKHFDKYVKPNLDKSARNRIDGGRAKLDKLEGSFTKQEMLQEINYGDDFKGFSENEKEKLREYVNSKEHKKVFGVDEEDFSRSSNKDLLADMGKRLGGNRVTEKVMNAFKDEALKRKMSPQEIVESYENATGQSFPRDEWHWNFEDEFGPYPEDYDERDFDDNFTEKDAKYFNSLIEEGDQVYKGFLVTKDGKVYDRYGNLTGDWAGSIEDAKRAIDEDYHPRNFGAKGIDEKWLTKNKKSEPLNINDLNKIRDQVNDGVTANDIGYLRQILQDNPRINQLTDDDLRAIIEGLRRKKR